MDSFSFSFFPNEVLLDFRLFQTGWEQCAPLHSFGPFILNHYRFHYVISGRGFFNSTAPDGTTQRYELEAGQGFLTCPGQITMYSADQVQPWNIIWLEFDGLRATEYLYKAGLSVAHPIYQPISMEQAEQIQDIMLYFTDHPKDSILCHIGHFCLLLDVLIHPPFSRQKTNNTQLRNSHVQKAIQYMESHYQNNITIEEIADVCRLNRSYFSKLFKEKEGCSPQKFLIRLRLSKAADLLRNTTMTVSTISISCGYPNKLHFSKAFKQHYGVSPREWRSQN